MRNKLISIIFGDLEMPQIEEPDIHISDFEPDKQDEENDRRAA